jgi:hypothetical protein
MSSNEVATIRTRQQLPAGQVTGPAEQHDDVGIETLGFAPGGPRAGRWVGD